MQPERWSPQAAPRILSMACASLPSPLTAARLAPSSKLWWHSHKLPQVTTVNPRPNLISVRFSK
jgi:hypothetical protein